LVGICARPWLDYKDFEHVLATVADHLVSKLDAEIIFLPFVEPEDSRVAGAIVHMMQRKERARIASHYSPQETIAMIRQMQLVIGMRLHSIVFAAAMGTPLVSIVYHQKVGSFLQLLDLEEQGILLKGLRIKNLSDLVDKTWFSRNEISCSVRSQLAKAKSGKVETVDLGLVKVSMKVVDDEFTHSSS
jgi:polysaccharide pyruvyl transferase WcaK-like protein